MIGSSFRAAPEGLHPHLMVNTYMRALRFDSMKVLNSMNRDLAKRLLELAETGLEGLEYVKEQNGLGNFEQAMSVLTDVIHSFSEIENVLNTNQPEEG